MTRVGVIVGSTRPRRVGDQVAAWVQELATKHAGDRAVFEVLDLAEFALPLLDELVPAMVAPGSNPHTVRWAERAGSCDAYVVVTPEYNAAVAPPLLNAIDYLFQEWIYKPVGYVTFGAVRAMQELLAWTAVLAQLRASRALAQAESELP